MSRSQQFSDEALWRLRAIHAEIKSKWRDIGSVLFCSVLFQAKIFPSDRKEQAELSGLRPQGRVMCGEGYLPPPAYWGRFWDFFLKFLSKCGGFYACLMRKTTCGQKLGPGRCSIDPLGAKDIKRTEVKNLTRSSTPKLAPELEHISVRCHCHRC